jgi:hypothetical protein
VRAFARLRKREEKAVAKVRRMTAADNLKICALLMPKEMKLKPTNSVEETSGCRRCSRTGMTASRLA